ncbi:MAG: hypothetical protein LBD53_02310 [Tannerella sp.]|nr:hypothetical protein [Tannerella sp.]
MTDVSSKPLAGFKTTAMVRGTVISTLNSQLSTLNSSSSPRPLCYFHNS